MSAQKALQGSETEMRDLLGGIEEMRIVSLRWGTIDLWLKSILISFTKGKWREKLSYSSWPTTGQTGVQLRDKRADQRIPGLEQFVSDQSGQGDSLPTIATINFIDKTIERRLKWKSLKHFFLKKKNPPVFSMISVMASFWLNCFHFLSWASFHYDCMKT